MTQIDRQMAVLFYAGVKQKISQTIRQEMQSMFYAAVNVSLLLRSYMIWLLAVVSISMFSNSINL